MKVYLVSAGEYSDWSIQGIFSTREKAEAFLPVLVQTTYDGINEVNNIDEWEIDAVAEAVARLIYTAVIDCESGEIQSYPSKRPRLWINGDACEFDSGVRPNGKAWISVHSPISAEHAAKLAAEKRQEWLRASEIRKQSASLAVPPPNPDDTKTEP